MTGLEEGLAFKSSQGITIIVTIIAVAVTLPFTDYGFLMSVTDVLRVLGVSAWAGAAGAVLGAIIGGRVGSAVAQGTQFGFGTMFLKFGREYERQADILGAQLMSRAGWAAFDLLHRRWPDARRLVVACAYPVLGGGYRRERRTLGYSQ